MAKPQGRERAEVIQRMRQAIKEGQSASKFISKMQEQGLSYRRTDMLADWRSEGDFQKKEGLLRFVRKDRYPTAEVARAESWNMGREYMFNVRLNIQRSPGEPLETQFVNIMSDKPMTPGQVEQEAMSLDLEKYTTAGEVVVSAVAETAIQRV